MLIDIRPTTVTVKRERDDSTIYRDSILWYRLKKALNITLGLSGRHALVKKQMAKDGHLISEGVYYLVTGRANEKVGEVLMIYDPDYQTRTLYETFNRFGSITLLKRSYSIQTISWENEMDEVKVQAMLKERQPGYDQMVVTAFHRGREVCSIDAQFKDYKTLGLQEVMRELYSQRKNDMQGLLNLIGGNFHKPFIRVGI